MNEEEEVEKVREDWNIYKTPVMKRRRRINKICKKKYIV